MTWPACATSAFLRLSQRPCAHAALVDHIVASERVVRMQGSKFDERGGQAGSPVSDQRGAEG